MLQTVAVRAALVFALVWFGFLISGISGCQALTQPLHSKPSEESPAVAATRVAIDEGYAGVISLNRVIVDNASAGVWTKAQAQGYFAESERARSLLDNARTLLRMGDVAGAKTQVEVVRITLQALQRGIASAARK
jgi:hypothetical protein